jgi:hypothetical protein
MNLRGAHGCPGWEARPLRCSMDRRGCAACLWLVGGLGSWNFPSKLVNKVRNGENEAISVGWIAHFPVFFCCEVWIRDGFRGTQGDGKFTTSWQWFDGPKEPGAWRRLSILGMTHSEFESCAMAGWPANCWFTMVMTSNVGLPWSSHLIISTSTCSEQI